MIKCFGKDRNDDECQNNQLFYSKNEFYQEADMVICEDSIEINNASECVNVQELENEFVSVIKNKVCTSCKKELPIEHFKGERQPITKCCSHCREGFKKNDKNRDKEHRNKIARKNEAKPERKAVKAKWAEDNYDKVAKKCMDFRQRKIEKLGAEEYLKQQAEQAKKWRENNPEKTAKTNENKKNSKYQNYNVYKSSAGIKNLEFTLTYEEYNKIVECKCHYCDIIQEKGFNGIDRTTQTIGYIVDNCVSCCQMCNYMKGSCSDEVFIKRIEHILTFQNKISGNLYPQCFADHKSCSYNRYRDRAIKKNLEFKISRAEFDKITGKMCYLCGKINNSTHKNGIDRFDNSNGYVLENTRSCCGECNFIKKDYIFQDIIDKFILIFVKHKHNIIEFNNNYENNKSIVVNKNKKSSDVLNEERKIRKESQHQNLKDKYTDDEYKKEHSMKLSELRKQKNSVL
jgi:hypothetical protein